MILIPTHKHQIRDQIETDTKKFLDAGGKIKEIISNERRSKKEKLIKNHLFFSVHHSFHAKNTGITLPRLKAIQRTISCASEEELETLWVYFRSRECSNND